MQKLNVHSFEQLSGVITTLLLLLSKFCLIGRIWKGSIVHVYSRFDSYFCSRCPYNYYCYYYCTSYYMNSIIVSCVIAEEATLTLMSFTHNAHLLQQIKLGTSTMIFTNCI